MPSTCRGSSPPRCKAGAGRACWPPTKSNAGRSAPAMWRRRAMPSRGRRAWRAAYRPNIRDQTPEGAETRANLTRIADVEQRKSNEMIGAELGYRYAARRSSGRKPGEGPEDNFMKYVPTTWPGARLPHLWLGDGTALHDRIGDGYTLLRLAGHAGRYSAARTRPLPLMGAPFDGPRHRRDAPARDSTATIYCCCGRTCMWSGAATACRQCRQAGGDRDRALEFS